MEGMTLASAVHAFAEAKPWQKAKHSGILVIGIKNLAERTAYAIVTGANNGHTLALCMNSYALSCYAALLTARQRGADDTELVSLLMEQEYLECRLDRADDTLMNRFLQPFGLKIPNLMDDSVVLRRHTPASLPDLMLTKEEEKNLSVALFAAADFAKMRNGLGISGENQIPCAVWTGNEFQWGSMDLLQNTNLEFPSPMIQDELSVRRLKKMPSSGSGLMCAVRILPLPVSENPVVFPWLMVMIDGENQVVGTPIVSEYDTDYSAFVGEILSYMEECGKPTYIDTVDPRTYSLLNGIAEQLNIPIRQIDDDPQVNETVQAFIEYMQQSVVQSTQEDVTIHTREKSGNGICMECGKEFSAEAMTEHVLSCSQRWNGEESEENFLVRISSLDEPDYWMYVELKKDASLYQLDNFIRDEWVECCGHLSMFRIQGEEYFSSCEGMSGVHSMKVRLAKLAEVGAEFDYEYDFVSPTCLHLEIVGECRGRKRHKKAKLTARNIRPQYACIRCGKQAQWVFRPDMGAIAENVFCDECAQKDENAPFMLPLLNSPRAGVCGLGQWMNKDYDEE